MPDAERVPVTEDARASVDAARAAMRDVGPGPGGGWPVYLGVSESCTVLVATLARLTGRPASDVARELAASIRALDGA